MHDGFIRKEHQIYYVTPKPFVYDQEHYDAITNTRIKEMELMKHLTRTRPVTANMWWNALTIIVRINADTVPIALGVIYFQSSEG